MNVKVAKTAGFCFGVERAVNKVYEEIEKSEGKIYTFGPIIHNEEVVKDLEAKGVSVINTEDELKNLESGTVIIRSHGVPKHIYDILSEKGLKVVDATCPFVKKIHKAVSEESGKGRHVVIVGDPTHPEVLGIMGWCVTDNFTIVKNAVEANELIFENNMKISIVSQTTFNYHKFKEIVEIITKKGYDIFVINTICSATEERQKEAAEIASSSDAMIVIGGKSSSNTQKLYEICLKECANTYYIQTLDDLDLRQLELLQNVGITAGASTPKKIIEEVQKRCQKR
ncbi:MAG: 4-hydroxy-3-methylbut-2-enyl diphosphate reductase [Lachnospiraceae bacterium]|nr:4-hydroxy-3-methylbut-2-enyl diphosphate reductase [Lachnospiraceae bacterium]